MTFSDIAIYPRAEDAEDDDGSGWVTLVILRPPVALTFKLARQLAMLPRDPATAAILILVLGCNESSSLTGESGPGSATPLSVVLTPATVSLQSGSQQQFTATLKNSDGSEAALKPAYSAQGGSITAAGVYTAGSVSGVYKVIARDPATSLADTSEVTVFSPSPSTTIYPGQDIQAAVNSFGQGTRFLLKAGVHRMQLVTPKSGQTFIGEPGAIMSGARLLTSFVREGTYWVATGQTQQGIARGECQSAYPACLFPEELFIDDIVLRRVSSLGQVAPGKWYFDYVADKFYFVDDPPVAAWRRALSRLRSPALPQT